LLGKTVSLGLIEQKYLSIIVTEKEVPGTFGGSADTIDSSAYLFNNLISLAISLLSGNFPATGVVEMT